MVVSGAIALLDRGVTDVAWTLGRALGRRRVFGGRPSVLGHRGLGRGSVGGHEENTGASFRHAVAAGLRWLELDVRRCADGALVGGHFPTHADGAFTATLTLTEARARGAVPLEELLDGLPPQISLDLDLKTSLEDALRPAGETTAGLLAPVAARMAQERGLFVSSFDPSALLILRERAAEVALGLLTWVGFPLRKAIPAAAHLGVEVVGAHWTSFGPNELDRAPFHLPAKESISVAHEAGLEVLAWTPPVARALELLEAGVDAVVVDDVPSTLPLLAHLAD
jgi:glycerophosphoryl diester phosphodiesterase